MDEQGGPVQEVKEILAAGAAVVSPDLYWTGEFLPNGKAAAPTTQNYAPKSNPPYPAFNLGYNRSVVGNRVHDLLTVVAMVRGWKQTQKLAVVADGKAGTPALLAKAIADESIDKLAVDLGGFDFDKVNEGDDEMLLPGALKYGGVRGFLPLCEKGQTLVAGAKKPANSDVAKLAESVTVSEDAKSPMALLEWVAKGL